MEKEINLKEPKIEQKNVLSFEELSQVKGGMQNIFWEIEGIK